MKRYVQVGCGARGILAYSKPLVKKYKDCAELCGVYDINYKRAEAVSDLVDEKIPVYRDFDEMLKEVKPDTVIVTSIDATHDDYVIRAMKAGCDVICEKPLTTTFEKAMNIKKVQEETGKKVTVTFNCRFMPVLKRLKEIVKSGVVGDILSVHFQWMLDTSHGADYFRRWHRETKNSGSLMVHKSTHHFDLINWILEEDPVAVNAFGTTRYYGHTRENRSERCTTCPHKDKCEFYFDQNSNDVYKRIYTDCEDVDGYYRDKCVFSDEIDIHDSVSVNVQYSGGTVMSYSLTAHSPVEGFNIILNGTDGRLEFTKYSIHAPNFSELGAKTTLKIFNRLGEQIEYTLPKEQAEGHGGSDDKLRDNLFRGFDNDPLGQMADTTSGLMSIGIGMAANISMKEGRQVKLSEFYGDLKKYAK